MDKDDREAIAAGIASPVSLGTIAWAVGNWEIFFWGLWIGAFLLVEIPAVFNGKLGDTFSETWWRWLRIKGGYRPRPDGRNVYIKPWPLWATVPLRVVIVGFGLWLIGHLGFGLWGGE
jgi:hypothetical protein